MTNQFIRNKFITRILYVCVALACAAAAYGQAIISTVAGGGFTNNAPALKSRLASPQSVALDASGNVYISISGYILKLSNGIITAVGGGGPSLLSSQDGPALTVRIFPTDLVVNSSGNLLFLDSSMLRELNLAQGKITTLAGQDAKSGHSGDGGPATQALLDSPQQIALDAEGNIYVVELAGYVRKITASTGVISTVAGDGGFAFSGDGGPATSATMLHPAGVAVDSTGNIYIADTGDYRIRKVNASTKIITTIAGGSHTVDSGDNGQAVDASFAGVGALGIDSKNNLYVIDVNRVRRIASSNSVITTVAGGSKAGLAGDGGAATAAELNMPLGLALDAAADLYIADTDNGRIRLVSAASGAISTIAGTSQNGDGGLASGAILYSPAAVAVDAAGNLYIGGGNLIRKVTQATGVISTIAGGGSSSANGIPATEAQINPISLAFDASGDLYVGEPGTIREISSSGTITTIAGTGAFGYSGDGGPAAQAKIGYPSQLAFDAAGSLYFSDSGNKRVRQINTTGVINTVAGNGVASFSGLGQPATQTGIGLVVGVAVDANNNIYAGGENTGYLLEFSPSGVVSVSGGNTGCSYIGDGGLATAASICQPTSLAVDASGNIFVGDSTCYCVRRIAAGTGVIQTVAGNGILGYSGDGGTATLAELRSVSAIALFGSTLYIVDGTAGVVRAVTPDAPPAMPGSPTFSAITSSASFQTGGIAPGELISFFGHYLGAVTPAWATLGSNGRVTEELSSVQVLFDGVPSPLIYVAAGQINAVAPYSVANGIRQVTVQTPGGSFSSTGASNAASAPAIFPYAIVNADGTVNTPSNPALAGTYVVMYGTGLGQTDPVGVDGELNPLSNFPTQVNAVALSISQNQLFGQTTSMSVYYAGPAPGLVSGVCQINVQIPLGLISGENFIQITAGPGVSPAIPIYIY